MLVSEVTEELGSFEGAGKDSEEVGNRSTFVLTGSVPRTETVRLGGQGLDVSVDGCIEEGENVGVGGDLRGTATAKLKRKGGGQRRTEEWRRRWPGRGCERQNVRDD